VRLFDASHAWRQSIADRISRCNVLTHNDLIASAGPSVNHDGVPADVRIADGAAGQTAVNTERFEDFGHTSEFLTFSRKSGALVPLTKAGSTTEVDVGDGAGNSRRLLNSVTLMKFGDLGTASEFARESLPFQVHPSANSEAVLRSPNFINVTEFNNRCEFPHWAFVGKEERLSRAHTSPLARVVAEYAM
jgi:hypothetical protein